MLCSAPGEFYSYAMDLSPQATKFQQSRAFVAVALRQGTVQSPQALFGLFCLWGLESPCTPRYFFALRNDGQARLTAPQ